MPKTSQAISGNSTGSRNLRVMYSREFEPGNGLQCHEVGGGRWVELFLKETDGRFAYKLPFK
jgi:hypothetical protein